MARDLQGISNITISGRIGSGATTLAKKVSDYLEWEVLDGGKLMRKVQEDIGAGVEESLKRPDHFDLEYEQRIKKILSSESHHVIQSRLAGYDAQGIPGVFKILVITSDEKGEDKMDIRIDRLVNRDGISIEKAKFEIKERDKQDLEKFRRLYANNDPNWVYWNEKYFDLVINTYKLNQNDAFETAIKRLTAGQKSEKDL